MMRMITLALALALAGCASTQKPEHKVTTAYVGVKQPCIDRAPQRPAYDTGKGEYPGDKAAAATLAKDFEKADQYGLAWEAAAAGCVKQPPKAQ